MAILVFSSMGIIPLGVLEVTMGFVFLAGVCSVPVLPSTYAYSTILVPDIQPAIINGIMMSAAQIYCLLVSLLMANLLNYGQR